MSNLEEQFVPQIKRLIEEVKLDNKPEELDELKKLIKKNVPFTLRGYFSAYLLRELLNNNGPKKKLVKATTKAEVSKSIKLEKAKPEPREIPEGSKTIYINLGKFGRVYAKELVNFICDNSSITKEDIFLIKIHDKYSFVTMSEENCNLAIEKLNGLDVKGRIVQVKIAINKKKQEDNENQ